MHKIVKGKEVKLSQAEIDEIERDDKETLEFLEARRCEHEAKCLHNIQVLRDAGMGDEAIALIRPELKHHLEENHE